ncbi:ATP-binding protein [Thalassospira mesophila]|uniref:Uncharacterized protein n=1 Tax=Thalassospira mesophila TaxID=1293891 RepID=A0A1Y2L4P9_9PROT|nr:ATP-binding protein [Thalassospira mesophila]OSQ40797.1 hypothetical protein TMES_03715 [Thalassospira mesophila]
MAEIQTEESPGSLNANAIIDKLAQSGFLSDLLADKDVKATLLGEIRELGFRPPLHYVVLRLITAIVAKSESFIGKAISSRLQTFIENTPLLAGLLQRLITIQHGTETKDALKTSILTVITEGRPVDLDALEIDDTTPIETMLALHNIQGFEKVLSELEGQTDTLITAFQKEIDQLFHNMVSPELRWPKPRRELGSFDRVKYNSNLNGLYGREKEIELLTNFAGDIEICGPEFNFRWMLIKGDGGTGKTRLAFDFTTEKLNRNIWKAGKLHLHDLEKFRNPEKWLPRQPTFIVIDYVSGQAEKTGDLLRIFANNAAHYDFPVRVLLLERKVDKSWLAKMLPENGDKPMVMDHVFGHEDENGLTIPPVDATAIKKMMKERFAKAGQTPPCGDLLLAAAQRVDTRPNDANQPRPLFALATAEAMIAEAEKEPESQPDFTKIAALLNQEDVLAGMLRREEDTCWQHAAPDDGGGTLTRYKLALALATLTQGLDLNDLETKDADYGPVARHLPDPPPDHHQGLISALGGTGTFLAPVEPDIMGEFFVARTLLECSTKHRHCLVNNSLKNGKIAPIASILRLLQDFPQKTVDIDIPAAMLSCEHEIAAYSYAWMAIDWLDQCNKVNNPKMADDFMDALKMLSIKFPKNHKIAQEESKAVFNMILDDLNTNRQRTNTMLLRLDTLCAQFSDNEEISLIMAEAYSNIFFRKEEKYNRKQIDEMLSRIDTLRTKFNDHFKIGLAEAKAAVNISLRAGEQNDWEQTTVMLKRIDKLRETFGNRPEIVSREAKIVFNIIFDASKIGDWQKTDKLLNRLDTIRTEFDKNTEVALTEAHAASHIGTLCCEQGNWERVKAMLIRFDNLRTHFAHNIDIAISEALTAANICTFSSEKNDWNRVNEMLKRLDNLRAQFYENPEIAEAEASAASNISTISSEKGVKIWVADMLGRLDLLLLQFPKNYKIAVAEANAAFYIGEDACNRVDFNQGKKMLERLIKTSDRFSNNFLIKYGSEPHRTIDEAIQHISEMLLIKN